MNAFRLNGFLSALTLTAGVCAGQVSIHLPPGVASERVFIRYVLAGEKFGGFVQSRAGVSSYEIRSTIGSIPATGLKAILYAPGCALQTLDIRLSPPKSGEYTFRCRPLDTISITGRIIQPELLYKHGVSLQARYVARWARGFLGLVDDSVMVIPIGDPADLSADGRFRISVPDLFRDPLAGAPDDAGELQIWAIDKAGGDLLALLIPAIATRLGGLKILREYPSEVVFAPCAIVRSPLHDERGFAQRSDIDGCGHP